MVSPRAFLTCCTFNGFGVRLAGVLESRLGPSLFFRGDRRDARAADARAAGLDERERERDRRLRRGGFVRGWSARRSLRSLSCFDCFVTMSSSNFILASRIFSLSSPFSAIAVREVARAQGFFFCGPAGLLF